MAVAVKVARRRLLKVVPKVVRERVRGSGEGGPSSVAEGAPSVSRFFPVARNPPPPHRPLLSLIYLDLYYLLCTTNVQNTLSIFRLDALQTLHKMHLSVVTCMESICEEGLGKWSTYSLRDASGVMMAITASDFISALVVTNKCWGA